MRTLRNAATAAALLAFLSACAGEVGSTAHSPTIDIPEDPAIITPPPPGTLSISPASGFLAANGSQSFSGSGGVAPYGFSVVSGGGTMDPASGQFSAPATAASVTLRITDSEGVTADAQFTVYEGVVLTPGSTELMAGNAQSFSASGGVPPFSYSVLSGGGAIDAMTGAYASPASAGAAVVRATDSIGNTADAAVTIDAVLSLSPVSSTIVVGETVSFSATGGVAPLAFSLLSGVGSVDAAGLYAGGASSGAAAVRVTDARGNTADAAVTVNPALSISPTSITLATNNSVPFTGAGGVGALTFSVLSGSGTINPATGAYTAPSSAGTETVRVSDTAGHVADATVTIQPGVSISPVSAVIVVGETVSFSASGGVAPLVYSVNSGLGSVSAGGLYTAAGSSGTAMVRVTDALGNTSDAAVTINPVLSISPASQTLVVNGSQAFSASGGVGGNVFTVASGSGSIDASGLFVAPSISGTATVRVTDSAGHMADAAVTIEPALQISPTTATIVVLENVNLSGSGGLAPLSYSVVSGSGSVNSGGVFTADATSGSSTVRVTDSLGGTADAIITVNPVLSISPSSQTLIAGGSQTFTAAGGVGGNSFSVSAGAGSVNPSGVYTAPASAGSATVRVTDSAGHMANASVTIAAAVALSPATAMVPVSDTYSFNGSGGIGSLSYSVVSGLGSIDSDGVYTAGGSAGSAVVRVTDSQGNYDESTVTVVNGVVITPGTATTVAAGTVSFDAAGGDGNYTFSITSGGGSIDSDTGDYTAPASAGSATVRVIDGLGKTATASITIYLPLTLSPLTAVIGPNQSQAFTATGGLGARTFSVISGLGTIDPSTGVFTAPGWQEIDTIQVADSMGNTVQASVTVTSSVVIQPVSKKLSVYRQFTFTAAGGQGPYTYSVFSGVGSIGALTGVYTAPSSTGSATVRVTDSVGNTSDSAVTVIAPSQIAAGSTHVCVIFSDGSVKCWGSGASGKLGLGDTVSRGDGANEMGDNLPFVNLGTGRTAVEIAAGISHTCARLDNGQVKCWGDNTYGQLGKGNTAALGDASGEMGDSLTAINLGTNRTAKAIAAHYYHTCAILDNDSVKCWGRNNYGQLGKGSTASLGDGANEMGDSLTAINLGTNRTAKKISVGYYHVCAILDNNDTKCWGRNNYGQLGLGDVSTRGDGANEMGDSLPAVTLGTSRYATSIVASLYHSCAILDNGDTKCWGRSNNGQLGQGNTNTRGDGAGEMGASLAVTSLGGSGVTASALSSYYYFTCAILSDSTTKCWGINGYGQLGQGSTSTRGDGSGEMGTSLAVTNLGTGLTASKLATGQETSCAILNNNKVKCWGRNSAGQLGKGNTTSLGDGSGEMGDSLTEIVLTGY